MRRDGKWFLLVTVDVPEGTPIPVTDFLGVDLGMAKIATDSDGNAHSGKAVEAIRTKHNLQRKRLGKRNTKGAKKKLKRVAGKEARFRRHENHCISKAIVRTAKGTARGIAVEDLTGIRERLPAWGRDARNRLSGWSFAQLVAFLSYKARLAGVPVVEGGPAQHVADVLGVRPLRDETTGRAKRNSSACRAGRAERRRNAALNLRALATVRRPQDWRGMRSLSWKAPGFSRGDSYWGRCTDRTLDVVVGFPR